MFWLFVAVALKSLDKNKGKLDHLHKEGKLHTPARRRNSTMLGTSISSHEKKKA